jgi:hypothetical protein
MIDEPLVRPFSPGGAIVRLTQIEGVFERQPALAQAVAEVVLSEANGQKVPALSASLQTACQRLQNAIKNSDFSLQQQAMSETQALLWRIYGSLEQLQNPEFYTLLGFPRPEARENWEVQAVDVQTVVATYSKPQRQVFTALSFGDAPGATFYRLQEARVVQDEDIVEDLLENHAPLFRVRLPIGSHRLRIVALNVHHRAVSEEFKIEVPEL